MPSATRQQECPRRAGASPKTGETPAINTRKPSKAQHRGLELATPRVLSASTFVLAGCASPGHQSDAVAQRGAQQLGLSTAQQTTSVDAQWWHQFGDSQLDAL